MASSRVARAAASEDGVAKRAKQEAPEVAVLGNFIGGRVAAPLDGTYIDDTNPATNQVLARIARSKQQDVQAAVAAAKEAFPAWAALSFEARAKLLEDVAEALARRLPELAALEAQDTGKPLQLALNVDIPRAIWNFRFFAGAVRHDEVQATHMEGALNYTQRCPVGVVGLITPWNFPLYLLTWKAAPALVMGNTVVAKPSELTPQTAHALAQIIHEAGMPPGVFNLVHGYGAEAGQALISHPDVHAISFTGGTVTGAKVALEAAKSLKKLSLELGGKNSTVVFADADFKSAVEGAFRSGFLNQGQVCLAGSRLFVQKPIYEKFREALLERVKQVKIGDPMTCDFGSLISLAHREKVISYVELARSEGGTVLCGGKVPDLPPPFDKGAFFEPTIIEGVSPESRCSTEEIFGPVVTIHPFDTVKEVVAKVNGVRYGLAGSIWTSNVHLAHQVAQSIQSGMIWVNCWLMRDLRVPFGGVKDSGLGREGGVHSLEFFSESKNICIKYA